MGSFPRGGSSPLERIGDVTEVPYSSPPPLMIRTLADGPPGLADEPNVGGRSRAQLAREAPSASCEPIPVYDHDVELLRCRPFGERRLGRPLQRHVASTRSQANRAAPVPDAARRGRLREPRSCYGPAPPPLQHFNGFACGASVTTESSAPAAASSAPSHRAPLSPTTFPVDHQNPPWRFVATRFGQRPGAGVDVSGAQDIVPKLVVIGCRESGRASHPT